MHDKRKELLLNSFEYSAEPVPRLYGKLIPLDQFIREINEGRHQSYMGTGELVLDGKRIEHSEEWISDRSVPFDGGWISLEKLNQAIPGMSVFWVTATELLF